MYPRSLLIGMTFSRDLFLLARSLWLLMSLESRIVCQWADPLHARKVRPYAYHLQHRQMFTFFFRANGYYSSFTYFSSKVAFFPISLSSSWHLAKFLFRSSLISFLCVSYRPWCLEALSMDSSGSFPLSQASGSSCSLWCYSIWPPLVWFFGCRLRSRASAWRVWSEPLLCCSSTSFGSTLTTNPLTKPPCLCFILFFQPPFHWPFDQSRECNPCFEMALYCFVLPCRIRSPGGERVEIFAVEGDQGLFFFVAQKP